MEITLDIVRDILRRSLGKDSFVASFITGVVEDPDCPTACISAEGHLRYGPAFVAQYVETTHDLFCLIMHELMHPLFGHFVHGDGELENLGADLVINAAITHLFAGPSRDGALFRKVYPPQGLGGLLRPGSRMADSRYSRLYGAFYYARKGKDASLSTGETITALKVLAPRAEAKALLLLGSHGKPEQGKAGGKLPAEMLDKLARALQTGLHWHRSRDAGYHEALFDAFIDVLRSHLSFKRLLLELFTTRRKMDRFRTHTMHHRLTVSPIPLRPSKRDLVLLAAGMPPLHYHQRVQSKTFHEEGLAVYLDVSGSVDAYLPEIIGLLQRFRTELLTIFLFSNAVTEVPFATLLKGGVRTTYGTDFDCVARSMLDKGLDKAVVLTDGYASMQPKLQEELRERKVQVLTVLFGGKEDCPEFAPLGDVVLLEDAVA